MKLDVKPEVFLKKQNSIKEDELNTLENKLKEYLEKGNSIAIICDGGKIKFRHLQLKKHE